MSTQLEMEEAWFEWSHFWKYSLNNLVCSLHVWWEWKRSWKQGQWQRRCTKPQGSRAWQKPGIRSPFSEACPVCGYQSFPNYSHLLWAVKIFFFSFWQICLKNKQASTTHVVILFILKVFHPWFAKSNPSRPRGNYFHAAQYSQGPRTGFENLKCS